MDLVSTTLDKYLKHRFNTFGMNKLDKNIETTQDAKNTIESPCMSNGTEADHKIGSTCEHEIEDVNSRVPTSVHQICIERSRPNCFDIDEDANHLAVGFDNSHIYLWKLSTWNHETKQQPLVNNQMNEKCEKSAQLDHLIDATQPSSIKFEQASKLLAHSGPVYSIQFIKNNDLMLSCSEDTTIRLWCLNKKCNLAIYRGHNYPIWSLSIGPRGEYFASTSMDATARLWRFDKTTPLRIFCGHDGDVECVAFHPNSKYIVTGSTDTTVRLWSVSDAKMVRLMIGHEHPITSLSFLPDGKLLASADSGGLIKIWNVATNEIVISNSVPAPNTISFNPELKLISVCGKDNVFRLWKIGKYKIYEESRLDVNNQKKRLISSKFINRKLFVFSFLDDEIDRRHKSSETSIEPMQTNP